MICDEGYLLNEARNACELDCPEGFIPNEVGIECIDPEVCVCEPIPASVIDYAQQFFEVYIKPRGTNGYGAFCYCDVLECVLDREVDHVEYEFCDMQKAMYRAIFHLADQSGDRKITYDDLLT